MKSNIKRKFVLDKANKYQQPCIITLSGLPGSGKTTCAKVLSRNLKVFIISNDLTRIYFNNEIGELEERARKSLDRKVLLFNIRRLIYLFVNRVSIVLDSDVNDINKLKKIQLLKKVFRYQIIKVKINSSNDKENLRRIKNRIYDNDEVFESEIIGDNIKYNHYYNENEYQNIKKRKPQLLNDDFFDYILDNNGDIDKYLSELNSVSQDIMFKKLVLKGREVDE